MSYSPYKPKIVVRRGNNCYNVVEEKKGTSPRRLASFPTKQQAENYKKVRRP